MPRPKTSNRFFDYGRSVFINCPFDSKYQPIFDAIIFSVIFCGFRARCALEIDDAAQARIDRIFSIIEECRYGIHDLSRTQLDGQNRLPRFNMPLELGMFLGARRMGDKRQRSKTCLILDTESYRYQRFISDIAGQDIRAHASRQKDAVGITRDWLRTCSGKPLAGGAEIFRRYRKFRRELPAVCETLRLQPHEVTFNDFTNIATEWLKSELIPLSA